MENMLPVTNNGKNTLFVLGVMIPPGETRHFPAWQLPPEYKTAAAPAADDQSIEDPLLEIANLSVAKLGLGLADLTDDELVRLEAIEIAKDKPRQGALALITAERLSRAEKSAPGGLDESTDESAPKNSGSSDTGEA